MYETIKFPYPFKLIKNTMEQVFSYSKNKGHIIFPHLLN